MRKMLVFGIVLLFSYSTDIARADIADSGTCNSAGTCLWSVDSQGKLSISGSGNIGTYVTVNNNIWTENQPWKDYKNKITSVDIQGVNNVSFGLFRDYKKIRDINIGSSVTTIQDRAFDTDSYVSVYIPETVTYVGQDAFRTVGEAKEIIISDQSNIQDWHIDAFNDTNNKIEIFRCLGDVTICRDKIKRFVSTAAGGTCNPNMYERVCMPDVKVEKATDIQCNSSVSHFWNGADCVREPDVSKRKCCNTCRNSGGWCNRIRYTIPEADEATSNDNENTIEWIFE